MRVREYETQDQAMRRMADALQLQALIGLAQTLLLLLIMMVLWWK